jgi:hypothetical protein
MGGRLEKEIKIEVGVSTVVVKVNELTIREIRNIWSQMGEAAMQGFEQLAAKIPELAPMCISGFDWEKVDDVTPSELKKIYDAFREVNAVFFEVGRTIEGNHPLLVDLRLSLINNLVMKYADLYKPATLGSGDTDSPSS